MSTGVSEPASGLRAGPPYSLHSLPAAPQGFEGRRARRRRAARLTPCRPSVSARTGQDEMCERFRQKEKESAQRSERAWVWCPGGQSRGGTGASLAAPQDRATDAPAPPQASRAPRRIAPLKRSARRGVHVHVRVAFGVQAAAFRADRWVMGRESCMDNSPPARERSGTGGADDLVANYRITGIVRMKAVARVIAAIVEAPSHMRSTTATFADANPLMTAVVMRTEARCELALRE